MNVVTLLEELRRHDIELRARGSQLVCRAPPGTLGPELREQLKKSKQDILDFLNAAQSLTTRQPAIVPLQPDGNRPPIFGVAGHNGDVFCYRALARHLGADQPFFGLQPPGLDGRSRPLTSVDELVDYFATQIRAVQGDRPCVIAGYCAGGAIAFALARKLVGQGAKVRLVALFGCPYPSWYRFLPQLRCTIGEQAVRIAKHFRALITLDWTELQLYIADKKSQRQIRQQAARQAAADPVLARRGAVEKATMRAVQRHAPRYFPGRLCLILPNSKWRRTNDRALGWPARIAAQVEEYWTPEGCENHEMLLAPHVSPFAAALRGFLSQPTQP